MHATTVPLVFTQAFIRHLKLLTSTYLLYKIKPQTFWLTWSIDVILSQAHRHVKDLQQVPNFSRL